MNLQTEAEETRRLLPGCHGLTDKIMWENTNNHNKNGIWSNYNLSFSYAILFFRDIY